MNLPEISRHLAYSSIIICALLAGNILGSHGHSGTIPVRHQEGFVAGTYVKTPQGYRVIEELRKNDHIISYNTEDRSLQEDVICKIDRQELDYIIEMAVDGVNIRAGPTQKFYCRNNDKACWVEAQNLNVNDLILIGHQRWGRIAQLVNIGHPTTAYSLSTAKYHNFFVSRNDILAHNVVIVIGTIATFELIVEIAAPAIAFGAIWLYCKTTGKKLFCPFTIQPPDKNDWKHILKNNRHDHGFNGKDPKEIWNCAQAVLMSAMGRDEIRDNAKYIVSGVTQYGVMEIKGIVLDGIVRVGTMYMKGGQ